MARLSPLLFSLVFGSCSAPSFGVAHEEILSFGDWQPEKRAHELEFLGNPVGAHLSGRDVLHLEIAAFVGSTDGPFQLVYHTEADLIFNANGKSYSIGFRSMRTRLVADTVQRFEPPAGLQRMRAEYPDDLILLYEYAILPETSYHVRLDIESYHLPPSGPGGQPRRRENRVLSISNRPLEEEIPLTPLYRDWVY